MNSKKKKNTRTNEHFHNFFRGAKTHKSEKNTILSRFYMVILLEEEKKKKHKIGDYLF